MGTQPMQRNTQRAQARCVQLGVIVCNVLGRDEITAVAVPPRGCAATPPLPQILPCLTQQNTGGKVSHSFSNCLVKCPDGRDYLPDRCVDIRPWEFIGVHFVCSRNSSSKVNPAGCQFQFYTVNCSSGIKLAMTLTLRGHPCLVCPVMNLEHTG